MRIHVNIIAIVFLTLSLFSCTKDVPVEQLNIDENRTFERFKFNKDGIQFLQGLNLQDILEQEDVQIALRSNPNEIVIGNFDFTTGSGNTYEINCNAIQNNGGYHGTGEQSGPGLAWVADPVCIHQWGEEDNRAIVTWEITENVDLPPVLNVGSHIYTCFEDNGQGANAPSDRMHLVFYIETPGGTPICEQIGSDVVWPPQFWIDINDGGHIKIQ